MSCCIQRQIASRGLVRKVLQVIPQRAGNWLSPGRGLNRRCCMPRKHSLWPVSGLSLNSPKRPSPVTSPMRHNAVETVTSLEKETIALEETQAGARASAQHTTITIPGITERRHATPVHAPADRAQPLSGAIPGGSQDTGVEVGQPHRRVEEPSAEGQTALPPGHSIDTILAVVDVVERLQRAEHSTVRPAVMPPIDSIEHSLAEAERGSGADSFQHTTTACLVAHRLAFGWRRCQRWQGVLRQPVAPSPIVPSSRAHADGVWRHCPGVNERIGERQFCCRSTRSRSGCASGYASQQYQCSAASYVRAEPIVAARQHRAGIASRRRLPAGGPPLPVAHARPEVDSSGSVSPPMRNTVEQIPQLQRTVTELAAQVAAQQAEQQANLQGESMFPPPAQPVVTVERATPPARTPRAFWERSYLSRLSRWPRR